MARLRVHAIGDQDSTGPWIREQFPGLFTITQRRAYRGMYRGGDTAAGLVRVGEGRTSTATGRSATSTPTTTAATSGPATLGRVRGIKEGDTPSFLSLVPNGLGDVEHPRLGSWGGRFEGEGGRLTDVPDTDLDTSNDPDPRMSSVYRWRPAFQADFAARLDWCVKPYAEANHPPVVRIAGDRERKVKAGDVVSLDAGGTTDPDGDGLDFSWSVYPAAPDVARKVVIEGRDTRNPTGRHRPGAGGHDDPDPALRHRPGRAEADPLRACPHQGRGGGVAFGLCRVPPGPPPAARAPRRSLVG